MEPCKHYIVDFIRRVLVIIYGNTATERSSLFNKEYLVENFQEQNLVSQKSVKDFSINNNNGNITKP